MFFTHQFRLLQCRAVIPVALVYSYDIQSVITLTATIVSPLQKEQIRRSFRTVARHPDILADLLYNHLFEIAPDCKMLFACDMRQQGRKLVQMLAVIVAGLDTPEKLIPAMHALGQRHVGYGATIEDYQAVGEALLYALQITLDEKWTREIGQAWAALSTFIIGAATA